MSWEQFTYVFGGLGLFLLGMSFLTDGLKALAGSSLRAILARFTKGRFSALMTGLVFTAGVQSSSVTTLAAIGFVNAGLLNFQQALGVLYGANLGTTLTGWMVGVIGIKVNAAAFALPLVGVGALFKLIGRGSLAPAGLALAGFGILFLGIEMMQTGMSGLGEWTFLGYFSAEGYGGRLVLVGIGALMTIIMQSSSAALAVTLTATATGAIQLHDAAALAIGQNVGTTFKAVLASLGGTADARRAAAAHVLFNAVTGVAAFILLMPLLALVVRLVHPGENLSDLAIVLAAFHSAFNLLGIAMMVPFIDVKTRFLKKRFRQADEGIAKPRYLDKNVLSMPATAMEAVEREIDNLMFLLSRAIAFSIRHARDPGLLQQELMQATRFHDAVVSLSTVIGEYLEKIERRTEAAARVFSFVRVLEHLRGANQQAYQAALQRERLGSARAALADELSDTKGLMQEALENMLSETLSPGERSRRLSKHHESAYEIRETVREKLFRDVAAGRLSAGLALELADYITLWERTVYHLARAMYYREGQGVDFWQEPTHTDAPQETSPTEEPDVV